MNFLSVTAKAVARRIRRWLQPSLVRRLLFAQIAVAGLLWCATLALFLYDSNRLPELVRYDKVFESIMRTPVCVRQTVYNLCNNPDSGKPVSGPGPCPGRFSLCDGVGAVVESLGVIALAAHFARELAAEIAAFAQAAQHMVVLWRSAVRSNLMCCSSAW